MLDNLAPVALFAYRRPDHLGRTLESLLSNSEAERTSLTIFSDGARDHSDGALVEEVRRVAGLVTGFADVKVVARPQNLGLAQNVISGVTQMLDHHARVIVLEDDMVVSVDFLTYMNQALDMYAGEDRVISIHGYVYPTSEQLPDTFFLRGADCWGWATWRRGWRAFDPDGRSLLQRLEAERATEEFDFGGAFPYTQMLRDQISGKVDSWAVRWYASAFLGRYLTLYPGDSLVENIGLDGSGTHSLDGVGLAAPARRMRPLERIPVAESAVARAAVARALRRQTQRPPRWWQRIRPRTQA